MPQTIIPGSVSLHCCVSYRVWFFFGEISFLTSWEEALCFPAWCAFRFPASRWVHRSFHLLICLINWLCCGVVSFDPYFLCVFSVLMLRMWWLIIFSPSLACRWYAAMQLWARASIMWLLILEKALYWLLAQSCITLPYFLLNDWSRPHGLRHRRYKSCAWNSLFHMREILSLTCRRVTLRANSYAALSQQSIKSFF